MPPDYEISTDSSRLDIALIHDFLSNSYWDQCRAREVVERSIQNSLCFGVYHGDQQVTFARVVTDRSVFAYLADVFVIPQCRGLGIAKALVRAIVEHPDLQGVPMFLLRTRDAHGLYSQLGFEPLRKPEDMMGWYR